MKFELFVDYTTDYEIETGKKYKTVTFTALNEFEAVKAAYERLTESVDGELYNERKNIYCVNVYRIVKNNQKFLVRYRYHFDEQERLILSPDWRY